MTQEKDVRLQSAELDKCIFGIANGDSDALSKLYTMVSAPVYAYALTVLRNTFDADDVLHDTVVKVYENAPVYRSQGKPMAWILTIAKNLCYTRFRQNAHVAEISDEALEQQFADNTQMSVEDKLLVTKCLSALPQEERSIVVLHAVSGLKHREIAQLLKIPLSTVLSKYNRSLKKLQEIISEED
ncbi:MAG: RNA polymerase sigma factor [Candidatus Fimimonas sp.]